jgi:hypothetical protein
MKGCCLTAKKRMWSTIEISINEPETWKYSLRANGRENLEHYIHLCFESTQQQNRISVYCIRQKIKGVLYEFLDFKTVQLGYTLVRQCFERIKQALQIFCFAICF